MRLKPAAGRAVRDPVKGALLPEEGMDIELDAFWRRRLRDGDVEIATLNHPGTGESAVPTTTASTTKKNSTKVTS